MATPTNSSGNLVDEFEESFQQCLSILTKDEGLGNSGTGASGGLIVDKDEGRAEMEQATMRFIDLARQMEAFFLQKRFLLSALKPELLVKEEINELKLELARKEELIKRHNDKIAVWQNMLSDLQGWQSPAQGPTPSGLPNGNQSGQNPQAATGSSNASIQQQQQLLQHQQQLQQQLQQQQQQQHPQLQQQLQQQMQHPLQQQVQQGSGGPPTSGLQGVGVPVSQQGMFMAQGGVGGRATGFPVGGMGSSALQGPLAYLEKTTSNKVGS